MPADIPALVADLAEESAALDRLIDGLPETGWATPTPATGWRIREQIAHLAYFDEATMLAIRDPDGFRAEAGELLAGGDDFVDRITAAYRHVSHRHVPLWYHAARRDLLDALSATPAGVKLPWYGPDMGVASAVTARLMETWAHGQDVADALGITRAPTVRLRHIAHLGVRTLGFSFATHGRPIPDVPVRVELDGPEGGCWTWGPTDATDVVRGDALDFCLVATRRRHRADTGLRASGPVAEAWLSIAQAYAGPPGPGRHPSAHAGGPAA